MQRCNTGVNLLHVVKSKYWNFYASITHGLLLVLPQKSPDVKSHITYSSCTMFPRNTMIPTSLSGYILSLFDIVVSTCIARMIKSLVSKFSEHLATWSALQSFHLSSSYSSKPASEISTSSSRSKSSATCSLSSLLRHLSCR